MAGRREGKPGGILGLLKLLDEHGEAIEYDLIVLGLRLDDLGTTISWRDLSVIVSQSPRDSALSRAILGDNAPWGLTEHLLALAVDALNMANWQRSGKKGAPKPKPVPRPGSSSGRRYGKDPLPVPDLLAWIAERER